MNNEEKKPAMNPVQPPNKLSDHEHDVWLSTYRAEEIIERKAVRRLGDRTNYAELAANVALDAYRKKCSE